MPVNLHQLRAFRPCIVLLSIYKRLLKDSAAFIRPVEKEPGLRIGKGTTRSLQDTKTKANYSPNSKLPRFLKAFYLHTDASDTGLGAVLAQTAKDKKEYAVAYASRSHTGAERNYHATELECLAVDWAVEHFHQYLGTTHIHLVTDHSALKCLQTSVLKGKHARWVLRLEPYNFTIVHYARRKHSNADALSRIHEPYEKRGC